MTNDSDAIPPRNVRDVSDVKSLTRHNAFLQSGAV